MKWKLACPPNKRNLVFPSDWGTPLVHCNLMNRHFKPTIKKLGLPNIRFHDLRHLHASYLIDQKESITYIQHRLGHTDPSMTLKVYSHKLKTDNYDAVCKLEEKLLGTGHKMVTNEKKEPTVNR